MKKFGFMSIVMVACGDAPLEPETKEEIVIKDDDGDGYFETDDCVYLMLGEDVSEILAIL